MSYPDCGSHNLFSWEFWVGVVIIVTIFSVVLVRLLLGDNWKDKS